MHSGNASSSPQSRHDLPQRRQRFRARSIFGDAVQDCLEILRLRQQSVVIDAPSLRKVAARDHDLVKRLLTRAISDLASVSRRGEVLSLGAVEGEIVIQSSHPLDIPNDRLSIDHELRETAESLKVKIDLIWDQGRGPRLTLSMPDSPT